ncbi:MAG: phenylacetic acid degradation protein PaaY [Burkholderiaceae bacterium]|nr:phenylacetic acid degradation protein PaaY [Burkholderiaceae bacterium]
MKQAPGVYSFDGVTPVIDPSAYVHPGATLIGDVIIGPGCFVAAGAVLRGDFGRIVMERESNLQDNCVVHTLSDFDCVLAEHSHIGHGAVVHAAHVGRGVLVGMNAVVMDRSRIGEFTMVAAMSFVKIGAQIPPRVLVAGVPAKVVRELSEQDIAGKARGTALYVELAQRCLAGERPVEPLAAADPQRLASRTRWVR